jgi:lipoprotein-anchoring transpeptidase ErfK/SrfK
VGSIAALTALLLHAAAVPPTVQTTPMRRAVQPADSGSASVVAYVKPGHAVSLRARPNGRSVGVVGTRTVFGSRLALPVVRRRGERWLGVVSAAMPNGRLGWVDSQSGAFAFARVRVRVEVDLSRRLLRVRSGARVLRRVHVGIGRRGSATPTGRFSITDKLRGRNYGSYYGCCILALSGHQPHTPRGWTGGARLAIHGGASGAVSAGCLHASTRDLRYLMRVVPLGTQVRIHA